MVWPVTDVKDILGVRGVSSGSGIMKDPYGPLFPKAILESSASSEVMANSFRNNVRFL